MRVDDLGVVTRGALPGTRRCDACLRRGRELRECRLVYATNGHRDVFAFWYDLCGDCRQFFAAAASLPIGKERAGRALDMLLVRRRFPK